MQISAEEWRYWTVDFENRQVGMTPRDGETVWTPRPSVGQLKNIKQAIFSFDQWWSFVLTTRNDMVIAEVYSPVSADPLKGRPTVYLDQNHWRTVADVVADDTSRVKRPSEIVPASRLIALAKDGKIVLPLSNGNMTESTALDGELRYKVGLACMSLAGGWQLRHPLSVRREEIRLAVARQHEIDTDPLPPCISLEPLAGMERKYTPPRTDFDFFTECVGAAGVMLDLMIDPKQLPPDSVEPPPRRWERIQREYTASIATITNVRDRRNLAMAAVLMEHNLDIIEAAGMLEIPLESLDLRALVQDTRMVRTFASWMTARYLSKAGWKRGDLSDIMYLSCAGSYADYVVTENGANAYLRQAARAAGEPLNSYSTIEDCVTALDADLASPVPASD